MRTNVEQYKTLRRKLRTTGIENDTFKEHMEAVSEYRQVFNTWNLPLLDRRSPFLMRKELYKPYRKFSIILKHWRRCDDLEFKF